MAISVRNILAATQVNINSQTEGLDIIGNFDALIKPVFPLFIKKLAILVTLDGVTEDKNFEIRVNGPDDELISKGEVLVNGTLPGIGAKKVIELANFPVPVRGNYSVDVLEKRKEGFKFIGTEKLFIANYPPMRVYRDGEVDFILSKEELIKTVKTEFKAPGMEKGVRLQLNLDETSNTEEGFMPFPKDNILKLDNEKEFDLTGIRREMEWMFGRPIPKQPETPNTEEK